MSKAGVGIKKRVSKVNKPNPVRQVIDTTIDIIGRVIASAAYGGFICGLFYLGTKHLSTGVLGEFLLPALYKLGIGFSQGALGFVFSPAIAAAAAPWFLIGLPVILLAAPVIYALCTGEFKDQYSQNDLLTTFNNHGPTFIIPAVTFLAAFATGIAPLATALWATWGVTTAANIVTEPLIGLYRGLSASQQQAKMQVPSAASTPENVEIPQETTVPAPVPTLFPQDPVQREQFRFDPPAVTHVAASDSDPSNRYKI